MSFSSLSTSFSSITSTALLSQSAHAESTVTPSPTWMWKPRSRKLIEDNLGDATAAFLGVRRIGASQWRRRYVFVDGSTVCYGKSIGKREKVIPLETIRAANYATRDVLVTGKAPAKYVDFGWLMYIKDKDILFCCENEKARREWVSFILGALQQMSGLSQVSAAVVTRVGGGSSGGSASIVQTATGLVVRAYESEAVPSSQPSSWSHPGAVTAASSRMRSGPAFPQGADSEIDLSTVGGVDESLQLEDEAEGKGGDAVGSRLLCSQLQSRTNDCLAHSAGVITTRLAEEGEGATNRCSTQRPEVADGRDEAEEEIWNSDLSDVESESTAQGIRPLTAHRHSQAYMYARVLLPIADHPYSHIAYKLDSFADGFRPSDGLQYVVFSRSVEKIGKSDTVQDRDLVLTPSYLYLFAKNKLTGGMQVRCVDTDQIIGVIESTSEANLLAILIPTFHDILIRITKQNSRVGGSEVDVKVQLIAHLLKIHHGANPGRQFIFREVDNVRAVIRRSAEDHHLPLVSHPEDRMRVGTNKALFPIFRTNADSIVHWSSMVTRVKADRRPRLCAFVVTDTAFHFVSDTLSKVQARTSLSDVTRLLYDRDSQTILLKCVEVDAVFTVQDSGEFAQLVELIPVVAGRTGFRIKASPSKLLYAHARLQESKKSVDLLKVNQVDAVGKGLRLSRKVMSSWRLGLRGVHDLSVGLTGGHRSTAEAAVAPNAGWFGSNAVGSSELPYELEDLGEPAARTPGSRLYYAQYRYVEELLLEFEDEIAMSTLQEVPVDLLRIGGGAAVGGEDVGEVSFSSPCGLLDLIALASKPLLHDRDIDAVAESRGLVVCTRGIVFLRQVAEMSRISRPIRDLLAGGSGATSSFVSSLSNARKGRDPVPPSELSIKDVSAAVRWAGATARPTASGAMSEALRGVADGRIDDVIPWVDLVGVIRCHRQEGHVVGLMTGQGRSMDVMLRLPNAMLMERFVSAVAYHFSRYHKGSKPHAPWLPLLYVVPRAENVRNALKKTVFDPMPTTALRRTPLSAGSDGLRVAVVPDVAEACRRFGDSTIYFSGVAWGLRASAVKKEKAQLKAGKEARLRERERRGKGGPRDAKDPGKRLKAFILILTNCAVYQCTVNGYEILRRTELLSMTGVYLSQGDPDAILLTVPKEYDVYFRAPERGREFLTCLQEAYANWTAYGLYLPCEASRSHRVQHYFVPVTTVRHAAAMGRLRKPPDFDKQEASRSAVETRRRVEAWHAQFLRNAVVRLESSIRAAAALRSTNLELIAECSKGPKAIAASATAALRNTGGGSQRGRQATTRAARGARSGGRPDRKGGANGMGGDPGARGQGENHDNPPATWQQVMEGLQVAEAILRFCHRRAYRCGLRSATMEEMGRAQYLLHDFEQQLSVVRGLEEAMSMENVEAYERHYAAASKYPSLRLLVSEQQGMYVALKHRRSVVDRIISILGDTSSPLEASEALLVAAFQSAEDAQIRADVLERLRRRADARLQQERLMAKLAAARAAGIARRPLPSDVPSCVSVDMDDSAEPTSASGMGVPSARLPPRQHVKGSTVALLEEAARQLDIPVGAVQDALITGRPRTALSAPSLVPGEITGVEHVSIPAALASNAAEDETRPAMGTPVKPEHLAAAGDLGRLIEVRCDAVERAVAIGEFAPVERTVRLLEETVEVVRVAGFAVPVEVQQVVAFGRAQLYILDRHVRDCEAVKELCQRLQELRRTRAWTGDDVALLSQKGRALLERLPRAASESLVLSNLRYVLEMQLDILRSQQHLLDVRESLRNQEAAAQARYKKDAQCKDEAERRAHEILMAEKAAASARRKEEYRALWTTRVRQLCHALQHAIRMRDAQGVRHCIKRCVVFQQEVRSGWTIHFADESTMAGARGADGGDRTATPMASASALPDGAAAIIQQLQLAAQTGREFLEREDGEASSYFSGRTETGVTVKVPEDLVAMIEASQSRQLADYIQTHKRELSLDVVLRVREMWGAAQKRRRWVQQLHRAIHTAFALRSADLLQVQIDLARSEGYMDDEVSSAMELAALFRSEDRKDSLQQAGPVGEAPMGHALSDPAEGSPSDPVECSGSGALNAESDGLFRPMPEIIPMGVSMCLSVASPSDTHGDADARRSTGDASNPPVGPTGGGSHDGHANSAPLPARPLILGLSPACREQGVECSGGVALVREVHAATVALLQSPDSECSLTSEHRCSVTVAKDTAALRAVVGGWLRILQHRVRPTGIFKKVERDAVDVVDFISKINALGTFAAPYTNRLVRDFEQVRRVTPPDGRSSECMLVTYILSRQLMTALLREWASIGPSTLGGVFYNDATLCQPALVQDLLIVAQMCEQIKWPYAFDERSVFAPPGRSVAAPSVVTAAARGAGAHGTAADVSPAIQRAATMDHCVRGMRAATRALSSYFSAALQALGPLPAASQVRALFDESYHSEVGLLVHEHVLPVLGVMLRSGFRSTYQIIRRRHVWELIAGVADYLQSGSRDLGSVDILNAIRLVEGMTDRDGRNRTRLQRLQDDELLDLRVSMFLVQLLSTNRLAGFFTFVFGDPAEPADLCPATRDLRDRYYQSELCVCIAPPGAAERSCSDLFSLLKKLSGIPFVLSPDRNLR